MILSHISSMRTVDAPDLSGEASHRVVGMPEIRNCHGVAFLLFSGKLPSSGTL